ncbi:MAG TPA: efflux RND transporter periplasmic adaptor subunit [Nitrospiria bacterium]|nr:efflux RND transporter periplasmic adaptor subunit [Nitrospiria bacterium]
MKWVVVVAVGLVVGGGLWYWMARNDAAAEYQTAVVTRGALTQVVTATGQLNPVVSVQVGSQISGIIQKLFVDFNSRVKAGQVIAQLDSSTFVANLRQAEGELANARAGLELARVKATRAEELRAKDLIPQAEHDQAQADLHQAEAAVVIREAAVRKAAVDLERCTIEAPIDGVVISRSVDVGQTVAASLSAPTLFVIANDLTKMQINASVAEADIGGVEVGQDVNFTVDAFPSQRFHGRVVQVRNAPVTVQNVVTYDTIIEVANPELRLKPGMTANVSIVVANREGVLTVPNAALRFRPPDAATSVAPSTAGGGTNATTKTRGGTSAGRAVYLAPQGKDRPAPERVPVKTGITDGVVTEVLEGLQEGDAVVIGVRFDQSNSDSRSGGSNPFGGPRRF